jgi:hypothetical protein
MEASMKKVFIDSQTLKLMSVFMDKEGDIRRNTCGIWIDPTDPEKPVVEASDGHRLHRIQINNETIRVLGSDELLNGIDFEKYGTIKLNADETLKLVMILREVEAISILHRKKKRDFERVKIKFSKTRIYLFANDNVLIRHIQPKDGIPEVLHGRTIAYNTKYLLEATDALSFKNIAISFPLDEYKPLVIRTVSNENPPELDEKQIHALMPIRLR